MKVTIDVPEEFDTDCASRFQDFWKRVITDMGNVPSADFLCDNYEYETALMLQETFEEGEYTDDD